MDKIELSNKNGAPVLTVGELKELLVPFTNDCEITSLHVFYVPLIDETSAKLEITIHDENETNET